MAKMGIIYRVANGGRRLGEPEEYFALNVEANDGGSERWLLFTEKELERVSRMDTEMDAKRGRLVLCCRKGGPLQWLVKAEQDGESIWLRIGKGLLAKAERRAIINEGDCPKKSWLEDLAD